MGYYKNLTNRQIAPKLYGAEVNIPANAKCVEVQDGVANAINAMAYPDVILEKVTPKITVDNSPIVNETRKREKGNDTEV